MILLDFNQIFISAIMASFKIDARSDNPVAVSLLRHLVLSTILSYKKKFATKYGGEIVLAMDNRVYWRREVFPHYKALRKEARDKSGMDWTFIFQTLDAIKGELTEIFPYKIIDVKGAEADDVIASIVRYHQDHDLVKTGLMLEPKPIMIVSADTDFCQLQKYPNVKQWSPMQKKEVKIGMPLHEFVTRHICSGDAGDGIPNILSSDDCLVKHIRQTPIREVRILDFITEGIDGCKNDTEKRNYERNRLLIDFDYIPEKIYNDIIDTYKGQTKKVNVRTIMNYLIKHEMRHLLNQIGDFK